jgi:hypothetical protein
MPKPSLSICLSLAVALLAPVSGALADDRSHLLDGMVFSGFNGEKGLPLDPEESEEIAFENGRFRSISCEPYNFADADYSAEVVGDSIHFQALTTSPTHGSISWKGVVRGDTADMTFLWTRQRWFWDIRREYWFKGSRK